MIQVCDLKAQYALLKAEIDEAMQAVAAGGHFIMGPNVKEFEKEVAAFCGCTYAAGCNSGTDALHLALRALHIGPGDEVITTPFTFVATTEAIGIVGATPVFVDIDPETFNLDPALVEQAITPRTKAILPVHLYGQPAAMDRILALAKAHNLHVVEDVAQAMGAAFQGTQAGVIGDVGCLSFFPSKNLGAFGDGGMVITNDKDIYERAEMLRRHGGKIKYHHSELGLNSRLDELQAAILRVKLKYLDKWIAARRAHAYAYNAAFDAMPGVQPPRERYLGALKTPTPGDIFPENELFVAYHQYTILVDDRDGVQKRLADAGVQTMIYYPVPLHLQEVHAGMGYTPGDLPHAEAAANRCLSLPIYPEMTAEQRQTVIDAVQSAVAVKA